MVLKWLLSSLFFFLLECSLLKIASAELTSLLDCDKNIFLYGVHLKWNSADSLFESILPSSKSVANKACNACWWFLRLKLQQVGRRISPWVIRILCTVPDALLHEQKWTQNLIAPVELRWMSSYLPVVYAWHQSFVWTPIADWTENLVDGSLSARRPFLTKIMSRMKASQRKTRSFVFVNDSADTSKRRFLSLFDLHRESQFTHQPRKRKAGLYFTPNDLGCYTSRFCFSCCQESTTSIPRLRNSAVVRHWTCQEPSKHLRISRVCSLDLDLTDSMNLS